VKKDAKNPSKLKTGLEGALGHNNTVRQNSVFLYGGLGGLINTIRKRKSRWSVKYLTSSSALRLCVWLFDDSYM